MEHIEAVDLFKVKDTNMTKAIGESFLELNKTYGNKTSDWSKHIDEIYTKLTSRAKELLSHGLSQESYDGFIGNLDKLKSNPNKLISYLANFYLAGRGEKVIHANSDEIRKIAYKILSECK
jgi:hypothetical protein